MRISVFVGVTIDGFLARKDGSYDFLYPFETRRVLDAYFCSYRGFQRFEKD